MGGFVLGNPDQPGCAVEFAQNCIVVLEGEQIVSLWLHPRELPESVTKR